jgi:serine/threonine protein kinase
MIATCPKAEAWQALLKGALPEAEQTELNAHLETCASCQQALEGLVASQESWSGTAKDLHQNPTDPTGKLGEAMARLKAGAPSATITDGGVGAGIDLNFLQPPLHPGHLGRLKHYEILEVLGKGAFGIVLKAHEEALDRIVAVKVLAPQLATSATARKRFTREAKAAAAVSHDHVVGIYAVDETDGIPYIAMQLVHGKTLQERLDQSGPLELKEILRIGMQIADGLAAAHKQGLVHRDIKPANILLENGIERVKITDFGLARAIDDASLTQSGVIAGTPMFMAPEQAAGEAVDHRADLFSLGSVLYTMCTGRPPFRATSTMAVLKRVVEETPTPIRETNPDIPQWLCDIIGQLMAKRPAERFQTAREVTELLGQHLAHEQQPDRMPMPARTRQPEPRVRVSLPPLLPSLALPVLLMASPVFLEIVLHLLTPRFGRPPFGYYLPLLALALVGVLTGFTLLLTRLGLRLASQELADGSPPPPRRSLAPPIALIVIPLLTEIALHLVAPQHSILPQVVYLPLTLVASATVGIGIGALAVRVARRLATARRSAPERSHSRRRWAAGLGLALGLAWLFCWFGPAALRYLGNRGELAFSADRQLCLQNIEVWRDGRKVTQCDPGFNPTIELTPGKYSLRPVYDPNVKVDYDLERFVLSWQLTSSGMFDLEVHDSVETTPSDESCELEVGRGRWVGVRATLRDRGSIGKPQVALDEKKSPQSVQAPRSLNGSWNSSFGVVTFEHEPAGDGVMPVAVTGRYVTTQGHNGQLKGTFNPVERVLNTTWSEDSGLKGNASHTLSEDGLKLEGVYGYGGAPPGVAWNMTRIMPPGTIVLPGQFPGPYPKGPATQGKDQGTWTPLFNGRDLSGWKPFLEQTKAWSVKDGVLRGQGAITSYLISDRQFENFELRAEVRINEGGKGGIGFRGTPGSFVPGQDVSAYLAYINNTIADSPLTGSLYLNKVILFLADNPRIAADAWFNLELSAEGQRLTVKVNGKKTIDHVDELGLHDRGRIALQVDGPKSVIEFRKIEVKELPTGPTTNKTESPPRSDKKLLGELQRLVTLQEKAVEQARLRVAAGMASSGELLSVEVELIEARVRLAEAERRMADVVKLLRDLVTKKDEEYKLMKVLREAGKVPQTEVDQAEKRVIEARLRLRKAESGSAGDSRP